MAEKVALHTEGTPSGHLHVYMATILLDWNHDDSKFASGWCPPLTQAQLASTL
jgi:hypothetical protein